MNFKKSFTLCLLLFPLAMNATIFSGMRLGFQQGYLNSRMIFSVDLSPVAIRDINRAQGGLFFSLPLGNHFSIQPELNYSLKGMLAQVPHLEESWQCDYLEFPLLMRFYPLGVKGNVTFALFAGPYAALLISARQKINGTESRADFHTLLQEFDLGMLAGISLAVKTGSGRLHFELRCSKGLSNLLKDPRSVDMPESMKIQNLSFGLLFGYSLPLGKRGNF